MTEIKSQKATNAILSLLQQEGIKKILYIDDKFDPEQQKEFFIGQMKAVKKSENFPTNIPLFETINWTLPGPAFDKQIDEFWENPENKKIGIHQICEFMGGEEGANVIPALEIEDVLAGHIDLLTPDEWQKNKDDELQKLGDGEHYLCLFDYELKGFTGVNGEKNGIELAKKIIESQDGAKVYCGIFSHKYSIEDEDKFRLQYAEDNSIDIKTFYTISKSRFAHDPKLSAFAEGIKNVISLRYIEDLKNKSKNIIKESFKKSLNEFDNLSPKTFNQIVQKSSLIEGVWEANTLFRLQNILQDYSNYELLTDNDKRTPFEESLVKIREIDSVDTGYKYPDKDLNAIEIHKKEIYLKGEIINKLHFPTSNGDIFEIGDKEYILLAQPCNLALRNDGKRSYLYEKAFLVPLDNKEFKNSIHKKLKKVTDQGNSYAILPAFKVISLNILDLSVYNDEGKCFMDLNINRISNPLIHFPWLKRYEKIHREFNKQGKAYIAFNDIKSQLKGKLKGEIDSLNPFFKTPECVKGFKLGNHNIFNIQKKSFDFGIRRVKNCREPYSTDLLQGFMQYLSRNGFDVDLDKE